jgi:hypothetical protein
MARPRATIQKRIAVHGADIQDGGQSTTPYFPVVDLCLLAASGLTWINRKWRGAATLQAIGRSAWKAIIAASYSEPHRPGAMNVLALKDQEVLYRALGVQRLLNLDDAIRLLRSEVDRAGSQRAFARKAGVNVSVVSKTLRGIVLPSEKILRALKLRIVYLSK